ncbi:hypothetical protein K3495_g11879, partial [Podosphaera aphanis]
RNLNPRDEGNVSVEINNLEQGPEESLRAYYGRSQELLRRSHGRDAPEGGASLLAPIEAVVLSNIVAAFLGGLTDDSIRSTALARPNILSGSLRGAYNAAEEARATIEKLCSMERTRAEKKELEVFRNHYRKQYQQPLDAARVEIDRSGTQVRENFGHHEPIRPWQSTPQQLQRQVLMPPPQQPRNLFLNKPPWTHMHVPQEQVNPRRGTQTQAGPRGMQNNGAERSYYAGRGDVAGARGGLENTPPRHLSRNPFVNGTKEFKKEIGLLCLCCGEIGHLRLDCTSKPLEIWEQRYLRDVLYKKVNYNTDGLASNQSSLRYREVGNSSWRDRNNERGGSTEDGPYHARKGFQEEEEEITLEQLSKEIYRDEKNGSSQSMSVVLGFDNEKTNGDDKKMKKNLINDEEQDVKMRRKANKRGRRAIRQLREIVGRYGMGPVNYKKMAQDIRVEVSLMDLFQMSPDLSKAFRKLSTRVNERDIKEKIENENSATARFKRAKIVADSEVLSGSVESLLKRNTEKAFRVPVVVRTIKNGKPVRVSLPLGVAQADQGSDMIIVTMGFLRKLGLSVKSLVERGFNGLTMNVADGSSSRLTHYSEFEIGVCGIWRKIEAFVRPSWEKDADEIHLLLGLPWLHSVDAKIEIRDSRIEIGDKSRGESVETIQGPKFIESSQHKLVLYPVNSESKESRKEVEESSDDSGESEMDSEEDEDSSDDEDFSDIFIENISEKEKDLSKS